MTKPLFGVGRLRAALISIAMAVGAVSAALLPPSPVSAAVNVPEPSAQVSFTFDDGFLNSLTEAAPTLAKHGLTGTNYVVTDCVGMTEVPNSCRANANAPYMTWEQVKQLQTEYGWEIGSHGLDHQCLSLSGNGCQETGLTAAQVEAQIEGSRAALADQGIEATAFAPPYGDYDQTVMATAAKYYSSTRAFRDAGPNWWPFSDYLITNVPVQAGRDTVSSLKAEVDQAIQNGTWVVFTFHGIVPEPSTNPNAYEFGTDELDELAAYVEAKVAAGQVDNVNVSDGLVTGSPNKLPNASFNSGISDGWRTDAPAAVTADAGSNGSHPDPTRSVKLVSDGAPSHFYSPQVPVTPGTNYLFKTFLNVASLSSGEVAFYVDEYDASGDWISGQYLRSEGSRWVEKLNFAYMPSSRDVATASLQVIAAGTGITAYVDNVEMLALGDETPSPPTNLIPGGTFEAGINEGWSTDAATSITADGANNGAPGNPTNSVRMESGAVTGHLFSPRVDVSPGAYDISAYLDVKRRNEGEIGWYIDEYDAAGNWISGQWKLANTGVGASRVEIEYSPSTAEVAQARLQVYVTANSGVLAHVDDISWWRS